MAVSVKGKCVIDAHIEQVRFLFEIFSCFIPDKPVTGRLPECRSHIIKPKITDAAQSINRKGAEFIGRQHQFESSILKIQYPINIIKESQVVQQ